MEMSIVKKELIVDGLDCAHCASKIESKVNELNEIEKVTMNFMNKTLTIEIKSDNNVDEVIAKIAKVCDEVEPGSTVSLKGSKSQKSYTKIFLLEGLDCAHCASSIEEKTNKLDEVKKATMNFMSKTFTVDIDEKYDVDEIVTKIVNIIDTTEPGLNITIQDKKQNNTHSHSHKHDEGFFKENKKELMVLGIGALVYIFGIFESFINTSEIISNIIFLIAYIVVGGEVLLRAAKKYNKRTCI